MTTDPRADWQLWAFGGADESGALSDTLWIATADTAQDPVGRFLWRHVQPQNAAPPARTNAVLVSDEVGGALLLAGGRGAKGILGDVWRFNIATATWTEIPASGPDRAGAFEGASVAGRAELVYLVGGMTESGASAETYVWNMARGTMSRVAAAGPARIGSAAAVDGLGKLYLFGGRDLAGWHNDLWTMDEETRTWVQVLPDCLVGECPPAGPGAALFADARPGRLNLYPGREGLAERVAANWSVDFRLGGKWQPSWPTAIPGDCDADGTADPGYDLACRNGVLWYSPVGRNACDTSSGGVVCDAQPPSDAATVADRRIAGASAFGLLDGREVAVAGGRWLYVLEPTPDGLRQIGRFRAGALIRDLAILGDRVLLATREGVEVIDVSDASDPTQERVVRISPAPRGIAVWSRQAAVPTRTGLSIVDPIAGTIASTLEFDRSGDLPEAEPDERGDCFDSWGWRMPIEISGSIAFVARGRRVSAFRLRTDQPPEAWAQTTLASRVEALRASGPFVFVVLGPPGERQPILDAIRPDEVLPTVGEHDLADWVLGATWQDGRAYRIVQHRRVEVAESF